MHGLLLLHLPPQLHLPVAQILPLFLEIPVPLEGSLLSTKAGTIPIMQTMVNFATVFRRLIPSAERLQKRPIVVSALPRSVVKNVLRRFNTCRICLIHSRPELVRSIQWSDDNVRG